MRNTRTEWEVKNGKIESYELTDATSYYYNYRIMNSWLYFGKFLNKKKFLH